MDTNAVQAVLGQLTGIVSNGLVSAQEQLPGVAQDMVSRGRFFNSVGLVTTLTIALGLTKLIYWATRDNELDDVYKAPIAVVGGALCLLAGILFVGFVCDTYTVWATPRLYIIEQVAALLKSNG